MTPLRILLLVLAYGASAMVVRYVVDTIFPAGYIIPGAGISPGQAAYYVMMIAPGLLISSWFLWKSRREKLEGARGNTTFLVVLLLVSVFALAFVFFGKRWMGVM